MQTPRDEPDRDPPAEGDGHLGTDGGWFDGTPFEDVPKGGRRDLDPAQVEAVGLREDRVDAVPLLGSGVGREPDKHGLSAYVEGRARPGQTVEHEIVRDRGDRTGRAVEVEVRGVGARVHSSQAVEQALLPCLRRTWRAGECRVQAVPDGSVPFNGFTQGAHGVLGVCRRVQHGVLQWRPIGPRRADAMQKRDERAVCLLRVDVERHDGKARRITSARLEGPVAAHSHGHFREWERRETSGSRAQGGQRRGEAFEVERIGNAARGRPPGPVHSPAPAAEQGRPSRRAAPTRPAFGRRPALPARRRQRRTRSRRRRHGEGRR